MHWEAEGPEKRYQRIVPGLHMQEAYLPYEEHIFKARMSSKQQGKHLSALLDLTT